MTPLVALAAAVRDRLLDGAVAPLPGIGTLLRAHVPARIQVREDGSRVLLPPGEAVGLASQSADPTEIAQALVRHTGAPAETAAVAFRDAMDQFEARLAVMGEARLSGVGTFQRSSGGVQFAPLPDLVAAVNQSFEGLAPVTVSPPSAKAPSEPAPARPVPQPPPIPLQSAPTPDEPDAVETLLDLIVNEPPEATETATPRLDSPLEPEAETPEEISGEPDASTEARLPTPTTLPSEPTGETPADTSPAESAFADDDAPIAVPFGATDLQDEVAPTPPAWAPDAPTVLLDIALPEETPFDDDDDLPEAEDDPDPEAPIFAEPPVVQSAADRLQDTPEADIVPEASVVPDAGTEALDRPSRMRAWLLVYLAIVLALIALLLWWTVQERRADLPTQTSIAQAMPDAPSSLDTAPAGFHV